MSIWKVVGGIAGGVGGFFVGGPAGAVAGASIGYGIGQSVDASNAAEDASHNTFNVDPRSTQIDPRTGIGQGTFGMTPDELARQRAATGTDYNQLQQESRALQQQMAQLMDQQPKVNSRNPALAGAGQFNSALNTPEGKALVERQRAINDQLAKMGPIDTSDPGRFAAMSEGAQGRQGITLGRFGVDKTAGPDMVNAGRIDAPEIYEMQRQNAPQIQDMQRFGVDKFNAEQFDIDPEAGKRDYQNAQEVRAKNLNVLNSVEDRALGRGGPSVAELQLKQGQDRAISQQAALAASGGQMDYAQARRQAMIGAADIGQKTAGDAAILRANEQISAQQTFGALSKDQQIADLTARGQTMNQANQRAQFLSGQSLENARLQAQQAQFGSQFQASQERDAINSRVAQMQFGAQFGLSQEQAYAQSLAQQRQYNAGFMSQQEQELARQRIQQGQWNAQFGSQQDQWAAQFQAQQELNQGQMTMQQRAMNDQYQQMLLNQYMQSRGMEQQNAFHNQQAALSAQEINAGISRGNQQAQMQAAGNQQQQATAMIGMGSTMIGSGMASGSFNSPFSSGGMFAGNQSGGFQAQDMYGNPITQGPGGYISAPNVGTYTPPPVPGK